MIAIFTNLVKNALKYCEKGDISIGYVVKGNYIEFFTRDSGIGIVQHEIEQIFDRFIRGSLTQKKATQGAGLGLAITKAYVEMLGGKLWVDSKENIETIFYFTLPYQL